VEDGIGLAQRINQNEGCSSDQPLEANMITRAQKPFSRATLYSSAIIFILFGAMGFFSIPAFSVLLLEPSWQAAGESTPSASRPEPAKDTEHLKQTESGELSGRPARAVHSRESKLSTRRSGSGASDANMIHNISFGKMKYPRIQPAGGGYIQLAASFPL
jgi:hypothetical protein